MRSASGPIRRLAVRTHCSPSLPEHRGRPRIGCTTPDAAVVDCATATALCIRQMPLRAFRPPRPVPTGMSAGRTHASRVRSTRPRVRGHQCDGVERGSSSRVVCRSDCRLRRDASGRVGHVRIARRGSRACFSKLLAGISITLVGVLAGNRRPFLDWALLPTAVAEGIRAKHFLEEGLISPRGTTGLSFGC